MPDATLGTADSTEARTLFRALAKAAPKNDAELYVWVRHFLGVRFPRRAVSGEHASPVFQMVADAFFERSRGILALGARDSMKTLGVSVIHFLNSYFKPGCETVSVGAIQLQAQKSHGYVVGFTERRWDAVHDVFKGLNAGQVFDPNVELVFGPTPGPIVRSSLKENILFRNGSRLTILPGTLRAVSGPHPQKSAADEVELWPWEILMKWWGMAASGASEYAAQRFLTSTRESMTGTMSRLIDEREQRNLTFYQWNVFDAMQGCKERFGGCLCKRGGGLIDTSACPLWDAGCEGRAELADGSKRWEEVVDNYVGTDDETWETQWLCTRPARRGVVYAAFDPAYHVTTDAEYHSDKNLIYMGIDPGYTDPYAVLLAQHTPYSIDFFDEVYIRNSETRDVKVILATGEWPPPKDSPRSIPPPRRWFTFQSGRTGLYAANLELGVIDARWPTIRNEWNRQDDVNGQVLPAFRVINSTAPSIEDRLAVMRRRLRRGPHGPLLRIHPRCVNFIWELQHGYRYKIDPNTGEALGGNPQDRHNHACDAAGYLVYEMEKPRAQIRSF